MFDLITYPDTFSNLHWQSDWNGDEVGYDNIDLVGLYSYHDLYMYIDMESHQILEAWFEEE